MGNRQYLLILVICLQFCSVWSACMNMTMRKKNTYYPIAELSFHPDDDTFPVGSWITINCTGIKPHYPEGQEKYLIPNRINIYVNGKVNRSLCRIARGDTRPVQTCLQTQKTTKPEKLMVTCTVDNGWDCSYHRETVYVKEKGLPYLSQQPPPHINVTEEQDLNMKCSSRVIPRPKITWFKDDVIITKHNITWNRGTSVLMLKSVDSSFQGKYVCNASNSIGDVLSNASVVTVFSRPRISMGPVNQSVAMGTKVSMVCEVTGLPPPVIGWLRDGVVLGTGTGNEGNSTGSNISVPRVEVTYPNIVSTITFTRPISPSTSIVVRASPLSTSNVSRPIPLSSSTFTRPIPLSTSISTRPIPLSTSISARPILPTSRPFLGKISQRGRKSTLVIESVTKNDEGMYQCYARNAIGHTTSLPASLLVNVTENLHPHGSDEATSTNGIHPIYPIVGTVLPLLLASTVVLLIIMKKRRNKHQPQGTVQKDDEQIKGIRNEAVIDDEFHDDFVYLLLMGIERDWEIPRDRLSITNHRLGVGCFGQVDKGIYTRKDGKEMLVAVKTLKDTATAAHTEDILAELEMLKRVGRHSNVVSLVGACTRDDPLCIIIEFVEGGSLNELLLKARLPTTTDEHSYENIRSWLTDRDLVNIAADTARGMTHLHEKNCIHRDLAARNILIGKGLVAKIADFGLARHVTDGLYIKQSAGKVPWKWMAPEALQGIFTTKSDVWSFGILLWEIATLGNFPYPAVTQVVTLYNLLCNGYRLTKPPHCDQQLYSIMMECWLAETDKRPEFGVLYKMLEDMLNQNERIYINLEEMEPEELLMQD